MLERLQVMKQRVQFLLYQLLSAVSQLARLQRKQVLPLTDISRPKKYGLAYKVNKPFDLKCFQSSHLIGEQNQGCDSTESEI